ncbi:MAG TPA: GIY-YIG nuclease family protein [Acidobacteriaceae bacterium]|jgi:hypothetical protein|nr:GIY-YIG nuclease family protein [Acidobacteriaceae bacterium]
MAQTNLPDSWYTLCVAKDVDLNKPGIYYWVIAGGDSYIGKYSNIDRPTKHYGRIVERYRNGGNYRPGNPTGFRRVHIALSEAVKEKRKVELRILENVEPARLQEREAELICQMRPTLNGPAARNADCVLESPEAYRRRVLEE